MLMVMMGRNDMWRLILEMSVMVMRGRIDLLFLIFGDAEADE